MSPASDDAPLTLAEAVAVSLLAPFVTTVLAAYVLDLAGVRFVPWLMALLALLATGFVVAYARRRAVRTKGELPLFAIVVAALFAWLLWLAAPTLTPLSTGPDLTHHLLLIRYIEEHWRLVHDPALERFLGEMAQYTPGSHILVALAGAWSGSDGLRAFHALQAATVALKAGFLLLIGYRLLPPAVPRSCAVIGVALLLGAPRYFLGGFTEYGFLAQVVAELFVIAMWWSIVIWSLRASTTALVVFGAAGAATFLTWPVYVGSPALAGFVMIALTGAGRIGARVRQLTIAFAPVVCVAGAYLIGRLGWLQLAGTGGAAPWPSVAAYGLPLIVLACAGAAAGLTVRRGRATVVFLLAVILQAAAFYLLARRAGAVQPYMALKMGYLILWPMAACAVIAVGAAWMLAERFAAGSGPSRARGVIAWALVGLTLLLVVRPLVRYPARLHPLPAAVSLPLYEAGKWARANLPSECVEYLVGDDETAYWLHLAVLGNPRMSARTGDDSTYEPADAVVRWLTPNGFPYAIADLPALPRDVRDELDVVQRFGNTAVVKRRGPSSCAGGR